MKKLKKEDFNAGTPYSCWLREETTGEIIGFFRKADWQRGLIKKNKYKITEEDGKFIFEEVAKLDDYPGDCRKLAVDIIRQDLDPDFEK